MALELIPVETHIIILAINYVPHLLLTFAIYRTGNRMWSKADVEDSKRHLIGHLIKHERSHLFLHFHAVFLSL